MWNNFGHLLLSASELFYSDVRGERPLWDQADVREIGVALPMIFVYDKQGIQSWFSKILNSCQKCMLANCAVILEMKIFVCNLDSSRIEFCIV